MRNLNPQVSIIIPTFNRAGLILHTLDSFINQSFTNWEALVIDDGSTDDTSKLVSNSGDERIVYLKRSEYFKKGPSGCRNFGLSKALGEYVLFFDDDDIAHPDLLLICVKELSLNNLDFCRYLRQVFYGTFALDFDRSYIKYHSLEITSEHLEEMITNKLPFNTCAVVWKKSTFNGEKFNEELFYSDEWEFYQRVLSKNNIKGITIDKILLYARKHSDSSTGKFLINNSKYLNSSRKAMKLVINNLYLKNRLTPNLQHFFVQQGFVLKDKSIIQDILNKSNASSLTKIKYLFGYMIYPVLKPLFYLKGKIVSN